MKKCRCCQIEKSFLEFHRQKSQKDGYRAVCKQCRWSEIDQYRRDHRDELKEKSRLYRIENPNVNKDYYSCNTDYFESYRQTHKVHYKQWREKNRKYLNLYLRNKRSTDVNFRLLCHLRSRISTLVRRGTKSKTSLTKSLLGCSIDEFRKYIETKFVGGMDWKNYGKWHLDHIIPCSSFDFSVISNLSKCFHYTNFQPLWATDNLRKGDRVLS